jgi:hypothetical protein
MTRAPNLPGKVELQGHVVAPVDAPGKRPLVLLLHGMFAACFSANSSSFVWPCRPPERPGPSAKGFGYIQEHLASQGYITVSVSGNGVSAYTQAAKDAGASARSWLVRRHLDAWASGRLPGADRWAATADLGKVLLVGHSRGGEGVDRVTRDRPAGAPWKLAGQVLIAPSGWQLVGPTTVPTVAVSGYCDGDTGNAPAQWYVDRPARGDVLRTALLLEGANHTYFNTEWTRGPAVPRPYDDAYLENGAIDPLCRPEHPSRLKPAEQQLVARNVVALAASAFLQQDRAAIAALDGTGTPRFAGRGVVRIAALGGGRTTIVPGSETTLVRSAPVTATLCRGVSESERSADCGGRYGEGRAVHWPALTRRVAPVRAVEATWSASGGAVGLALDQPLDLSSSDALEARVVVHPDRGPVTLDVRLTDASGVAPSCARTAPCNRSPAP